MPNPTQIAPRLLHFGAYVVDLRLGELRKHGTKIRLQEQPFQVLAMLLERPGELVTREELHQRLWPADTFVDFDHGLNAAINRLRQRLSDNAEKPQFIETIPRRGYRFVAPVSSESAPGSHRDSADSIAAPVTHKLSFHALYFYLLGAALLLAGWGYWESKSRSALSHTPDAIAVLPLENLSGDPNEQYLADGITDELITDLARATNLRVISRTSSMQYQGAHKPLPQIAHELHVNVVVEGSVVRREGKVRVTAQLLLASADRHLWAQSYERNSADVFDLQRDIAADIAREIQAKLSSHSGRDRAAHQPNPRAYEAYLKARFYLSKGNAEGTAKALDLYQEAISNDKDYADAYAGLALAYRLQGLTGAPLKDGLERSREAALAALRLDPACEKAYEALGWVQLVRDWDFANAEKQYQRAIQLSPGDPSTHEGYAAFLLRIGRLPQAEAELQHAIASNPVSLDAMSQLGYVKYFQRNYRAAIDQFRQALDLDPHFAPALFGIQFAYEQNHQYLEAEKAFQQWGEAGNPGFAKVVHAEPLVPGEAGYKQDVRAVNQVLIRELKTRYHSPYTIAADFAYLGEKNEAFAWLQQAFTERDPKLLLIRIDPEMDSLRRDPRYADLVKGIGLPD